MDDSSPLLEECPPPKRFRRSTYNQMKINQDNTNDCDVMSDSDYDPLQDNDQDSDERNDESGSAAAQKPIRIVLGQQDTASAILTKRPNYACWNNDGLASFVRFVHEFEAMTNNQTLF